MRTLIWEALDTRFRPEHLGFIPGFLFEDDPRPAKEQIDDNYRHGGGWSPLEGWEFDRDTFKLRYPGDPSMRPLATTKLRDETILFYDYSWLLILQPDGSFEVSRLD